MPERLLSFLGVVGLITVLPGPDMALVLRNGVRGGSRAAWHTGLGCCTGITVWAATSIAGVAALVAASGRAFDVLRIAGAVYLAILGLGALQAALGDAGSVGRGGALSPPRSPAVRTALPPTLSPLTGSPPTVPLRRAFRQGLVSNLLNPKIALLFLTLLPQFVAPGEARIRTTAALAATFLVLEVVWWRVFSLALEAAGRALTRTPVRRAIEGLAGTVLVGLAVRVAVERR